MFESDFIFTGFYGQKNAGDDAFVEVTAWGADKYWNTKKIRFLAKSGNLPTTPYTLKGFPLSVPKSYNFQTKLLLKKTKCLVSAGGSTIHRKLDKNSSKYCALRLKELGHDIKVGGIGVSIGPFKSKSDEIAVNEYLKKIDFLVLRDQHSYDYAMSVNLPYLPINSFDLAALLPEVYNYNYLKKKRTIKKIIGVSVCQYESLNNVVKIENEHYRNYKTIELLKCLDSREDIDFKFYIINGNDRIGDIRITNYIIGEVKPKNFEIINYNKNTQETWKSIANCDFMISTRLHGAIFACFSKTPFVLNEYHRKCGDFLDTVGYHRAYRLYNSEYDPSSKANQILDIINNPNEYIPPTRVDEMIELARLNFTSIHI